MMLTADNILNKRIKLIKYDSLLYVFIIYRKLEFIYAGVFTDRYKVQTE